jgi:hypothetical protein
MARLTERVAVLERIATDPAARTALEIESLRRSAVGPTAPTPRVCPLWNEASNPLPLEVRVGWGCTTLAADARLRRAPPPLPLPAGGGFNLP